MRRGDSDTKVGFHYERVERIELSSVVLCYVLLCCVIVELQVYQLLVQASSSSAGAG